MDNDIRQLVREVLQEELGKLRGAAPARAGVREEFVELDSDADLARFVRRILQAAGNATARGEIESGRHVFRLAANGSGQSSSVVASGGTATRAMRFSRSLFVEKDVKNLSGDVNVVQVDQHERFTPLAKDELQRLGIRIERMKS